MWEEGGGDELSEKCVLRGGNFFIAPVYISSLRNFGMCWGVVFFCLSRVSKACNALWKEWGKKSRIVLVPTEPSVCNVV